MNTYIHTTLYNIVMVKSLVIVIVTRGRCDENDDDDDDDNDVRRGKVASLASKETLAPPGNFIPVSHVRAGIFRVFPCVLVFR